MALNKPLEELSEADLAALIAAGTPELKTLEPGRVADVSGCVQCLTDFLLKAM